MPKRYRRRPNVRTRRRRRKKKNKMSRIVTYKLPSPSAIVPDILKCKMVYKERISHNFAALAGSYLFNLNDLHDPNRTGVGHQPMGYDQLSNFYNRYRVHGCAWRVTVAGCNTPVRFAVAPFNGTASTTDLDDCAESPYGRERIVSSIGGKDISVVKGYIGIGKIMGRPKLDERDEAVIGVSPNEKCILVNRFESLDGSTNMNTISVTYQLTYYCEFFDRKQLGGS